MAHKTQHVLVIFDLVATLTDAAPRYVRAFEEVCANNNIAPPSDEEVREMLGNKNLSEITDILAGPMEPKKKKDFMDACNQACDALLYRTSWHEALYPNVREAVHALHARGVALGIFTGTRENAMEEQLAYHKISADFDPRYRRGKDNKRDEGKTNDALKTEQLASIIAQFKKDISSENISVIVVGDSASDAQAAENLNLQFVGFAMNDARKEQLQKAGIKTLVQDFSALPDLVGKLSRKGQGAAVTPCISPRFNRP